MPGSQAAGSLWIGCEERCSSLWALQSQVTDRGKCWAWTIPAQLFAGESTGFPLSLPQRLVKSSWLAFLGSVHVWGLMKRTQVASFVVFSRNKGKCLRAHLSDLKRFWERQFHLCSVLMSGMYPQISFSVCISGSRYLWWGSPTSKPASVMHTPLLCCCQPDHCHAMHGTADSRC